MSDDKATIAALEQRVRELKQQVYVPGLWRCAKCEFQLVQANLNARDGSVTCRDEPGDECPNCEAPLWRVSEREAGNNMVRRAEEFLNRATAAQHEAAALREENARLVAFIGLTVTAQVLTPALDAKASALLKGDSR